MEKSETHQQELIAQNKSLLDFLEMALEWIDAVPDETVLPVMPGFDRDYVNAFIDEVKESLK